MSDLFEPYLKGKSSLKRSFCILELVHVKVAVYALCFHFLTICICSLIIYIKTEKCVFLEVF